MHPRRLFLSGLLAAAALGAVPPARAEEEEKKKGGGTHFIAMQALTATILRADRRRGVLTVEIGLDVPNSALLDRARASLPRLRAAYVEFLVSYASRLGPATPPNADYLSSELQRITDRALGQAGARLLLGTILVS